MKWIVLFLLTATSLFAQSTLPEELAITRSIVMQDADELEISAPVQYFKLPDQKQLTCATEMEYGLTENWELDAELPYVFSNPTDERSRNGIGDVEAAVRYGLFRDHLVLGLGVVTPTGSRHKEIGEGQVSLEPSFTVSQWFGKLNAQFNGGWQHTVTNGGEEPRNDFEYNLAVLYPIHAWYIGLEGNGETNHERTKYYITPEIIWKPNRRLQLLLAAPIGITQAAGDYGIIASVTVEFDNVTKRGHDDD